jgi:hypothetical protein
MTKKRTSEEDLAKYFEAFDFDSALRTDRSPLRALHWATQFREYIDQQLANVVQEARKTGATWTQIGDALGVSHQAAMKRFKERSRQPASRR